MDAQERGALMLVRFVAVALIGMSAVETGLYAVLCRQHQTAVEIMPCVIRSLPLVAGVLILVKSRSLAVWISDLMDL